MMSLIEWAAALIIAGIVLVVCQLSIISARLFQTVVMLQSLDAELFRLAQQQNPTYGLCSECGRRAIVRHVVPKDSDPDADDPEMFYCMNCWWMSETMQVGKEDKYYKDRRTDEDRIAARIGPGQP